MKPIKPEEVVSEKVKFMPKEVFESFNELIVKNWNGRSSKVEQDEVVDLILTKLKTNGQINESSSRQILFDKRYLEVEDIYKEAGWDVKYDNPGYNESYGAFFVFKKA